MASSRLACTGHAHRRTREPPLVGRRFREHTDHAADESGRAADSGPRRTLKGGHSRSFPIHRNLLAVLKRLPQIDSYVFHGPRRGRLKADTLRRVLVRDVLKPLVEKFPAAHDAKGFVDGRLHSFRHYFVSSCATNHVPERVVMEWVGHADSSMVRHYFHLHDEEARGKCKASTSSVVPSDVPMAMFRSPNRGGNAEPANYVIVRGRTPPPLIDTMIDTVARTMKKPSS